MKGIKRRAILIHMIGVIIARAAFFGMNPFAIGYFAAAYLEKAGGGFAFVAVLLGIMTVMPPLKVLMYLLAMAVTIVILEAPIIKKKQIPIQFKYALPALVVGIFSSMEVMSSSNKSSFVMLTILEVSIIFVSGIIFQKGIAYLLHSAKGKKMDNEQMLSMAVIVAIVVYAIPDFAQANISPVETIVYFVILFSTYKYGVGQGAITAAVCGFVMSFRGEPISDMALLCVMGIVPAIFRELGRFPVATMYMITATAMGLLYEGMLLNMHEIGGLASAVIVFLLLPKSLAYRIDSSVYREKYELLAVQNIRDIAKIKMVDFSNSFLKLSKSFGTIAEKQSALEKFEINRIFEDLSEKLCKNCRNCSKCWESDFNETYQEACHMFDMAEKNGYISKEDVPTQFAGRCICTDQFLIETNRGFEIAKLNRSWHNKMAESREAIAGQLKEVSSVIRDFSSDLYATPEASITKEERVIHRLRANHILTKSITMIERNNKRQEIYLKVACKHGRCMTTKEAANMISDELGIRMCASQASKSVISKDYDTFIFVEDTKFKVLTGLARAMKGDEKISGDNFSFLKLDTGEMVIALSDGMGTGKAASDESEAVIVLLEQLIEAGFKEESAIRLINSSLVLKEGEQPFSTIDMSIINLFTGICEFIKIGAAATFIKRDQWVETIRSTTLPVGILNSVDYDSIKKKLYDGDIIIMVSDGVLDSIREEDKEKFMENMIMEMKSNNPQEIANLIMDQTLAQREYIPMDDMTIITAGLWSKL